MFGGGGGKIWEGSRQSGMSNDLRVVTVFARLHSHDSYIVLRGRDLPSVGVGQQAWLFGIGEVGPPKLGARS